MDEKLKSTIDKIVQLSKQNPEFDAELRKRLEITSSANYALVEDERISQIYEYCIEKVIRSQAIDFYNDFPLKSIIPTIVEDFVRMEIFRRKDNFGDFCLSLYQQIECITNKLCTNPSLSAVVEKMMGHSPYVKSGKNIETTIGNRVDGEYTIAALLFPGQNKKTGLPYSIEKSKVTLQSQYANDKMRILVYFIGYKTLMKSSDYDSYIEFTSLLSDIYQCRNMNHRGNTLNEWEQSTLNRISPLKSFYYFKFMGVLAQYVDYIRNGVDYIPELKKYSDSIKEKKISPQLKVLGKVDLKDDGKKESVK